MYVLDEYPSEQTHFHVRGYDVAIENEDLANALTVLPDDKRDITVTSCNLDGKCVIVAKDTTKTKSSRRTLPLVPYFHEKLLAVKAQQERNQKLCGRSYNREFLEYICVDDIGDRFKPNYITSQFPKLLERNGFRKIRFHDLRHSCASLLLASGVPMKHIQEWLGHSDFSTTANIYAHLDYSSKLTSASAMESNFHLGV